MAIGIINVKKPKTKLLFLLALNSFMSNSKPAINMMYNKPIVEKSLIAESFARIFKPCGPIITPAIIKPIIPGIFNFLRRMGESKMINKIILKN